MPSMPPLRLFKYLCLLAVVTIVFGTIELVAQQGYRQGANDPQIQMAEDGVGYLEQGMQPTILAGSTARVDMSRGLSPFVMIFDTNGKLEGTSAVVGTSSEPYLPPQGLFASAKAQGQDRVTWQTANGLRFAAVIQSYSGGYVLAARSLRETEIRENKLAWEIGIPWAISVALVLAYGFFAFRHKKG